MAERAGYHIHVVCARRFNIMERPQQYKMMHMVLLSTRNLLNDIGYKQSRFPTSQPKKLFSNVEVEALEGTTGNTWPFYMSRSRSRSTLGLMWHGRTTKWLMSYLPTLNIRSSRMGLYCTSLERWSTKNITHLAKLINFCNWNNLTCKPFKLLTI